MLEAGRTGRSDSGMEWMKVSGGGKPIDQDFCEQHRGDLAQ